MILEVPPVTTGPETVLNDAIAAMSREAVDVLVVLDNQIPVGLLTAADVVRGVAEGIDFTRVPVAEVMGSLPPTVPASELADIPALWQLCDRTPTGYLIVVGEGDEFAGLISRSSLLKNIDLAALQRQIARLEAENAELRDTSHHNLQQIEQEFNDLKSRFITTVSHEFRTPLTTISFSAGLLENHGKKFSDEKQKTHFHRIKLGIQQMTEMLNDILIIGQAEAGKILPDPTPIDITQFCANLVEEFQLTTDSHNLVFTAQTDCPQAHLDEHLLNQILGNLISNAMKYSPQGGDIKIELSCGTDRATFRIQDWGIGIPEKDREYLFEPFHRASNVGTISGTGLGLPLVKKAVDLQGGEITVETEEDRGTTCTVILPLTLKK
ncbi:MAG: ATP-binding protein [Limnospira sp.]